MSTLYPAAVDDNTTLPNPSATSPTNSPSLAGGQSNQNDAIKAAETKLGTGVSTPAANRLFFGTGTGTSAWTQLTSAQLAASLSDETGSGLVVFGTSPILITPKVDTINENTVGNGVTVGGINFKSGVVSTSNSVPTAALQDSSVTSAKAAVGFAVQQVNTLTSAVATGTGTIPLDDTIPQITEGDQYMTVSITPKSATNILVIQSTVWLSHSVGSIDLTIALFQDAIANALATNGTFMFTATGRATVPLFHSMIAGTTSPITFRIRAGGSGAGTTTFNGVSGVRFYGTSTKSSLIVTEYKA